MSQLPRAKNTHLSIDATTLVNKYLELSTLVPHKMYWSEGGLKNNPPAYYRWIQLKCLCKVFRVNSIEMFLNGEFLFERDMELYSGYFSQLKSRDITRQRNEELKKEGSNSRVRSTIFLSPKTKEDMQYIIDSYKEHFIYLERSYCRLNDEGRISNEVEKERWLFLIKMAKQNICQLVSPEREEFLISDLIKKYGCPDVDVFALDEFHK